LAASTESDILDNVNNCPDHEETNWKWSGLKRSFLYMTGLLKSFELEPSVQKLFTGLCTSTSFDVNIDTCLSMTCCPKEKYCNNSTLTDAIDTYVFDSFCGWYRRPRRRH
jgi:hypothetical protein